jgi:drug/metabolite transporter (DMT)-like permease
MSVRTVGVLLIAISAASFGAMAIFARLAYDAGADVTAVLFLRFALAAPCMALLLRARGLPWPRGRTLAGLAAMGGLGYVGQSFSFFTALTMASASLVALLLYLYPAIVTVLSTVVLGDRLTPRKVVALVVAMVGTALTIGPELSGRPLGIALGAAAAVIYSVYILVGSRLTPRSGALPSSAVVMTAAAAVYAVVAVVQRPAFPVTRLGWAAVVAIALVSTVVAITTFFAGMARLGAADASTLSTLEPVVTVALAAAVLHERISAVQLAGGALILGAVVLLARTAATGREGVAAGRATAVPVGGARRQPGWRKRRTP